MESKCIQSEKSLTEEARTLFYSKQYEEAIKVVNKAMELYPCSISICHLGTTTSLAKGDAEECRRYGESIQLIDPDNPLGYHAIANSYLTTEKPYDYREHQSCQTALDIASEGLKKNPKHPGLILTVVRTLMALGLFQEALVLAEQALELNPQLDGAFLYAAQSALALDNYDKASRFATQLKNHISLSSMANEVIKQVAMSQIADTLIASSLNTISRIPEYESPHYEQVISLGCDCLPAALIAQHGQRSAAMPFDWLICPAETLIQIFKSDFEDFLDPNLLAADPSNISSHHLKYKELRFPHHNLTLPEVRSTFTRRVERFCNALKSKNRILFVIYQAKPEVVLELSEYLPASSTCLSLWLEDCTHLQTPFMSASPNIIHMNIPAFTSKSVLPLSWPAPTNHKAKSGGDIQCKYARKMVDSVLKYLL